MSSYAVLIGSTVKDIYTFNDPNKPDKAELYVFNEYEIQKMLDFIQVIIERKAKVVAIMPHDALPKNEEL